ncbi:acetyltransferase [uncultured Aquimarina sp.]|uniref:acetyltransferase n=1 Tax=uncultured Aquimarina sp. TaxID=575652 RepID=UPI00260C31A1|nr:acetyltransferase [uncultured Aquimarina sp.]
MNKILGILGAGHLGQQIAHYAIEDNHYDKVVFFDDFTQESIVNGHQVIGKTEDVLPSFSKKKISHLMTGVGYKHMDVRAKFYNTYKNEIPFATIIHSSCWVDPTAKIGKGVVIYPNSTIDSHAVIKNNVLLNIGCTIAHNTIIESHCFLSPRVALAGFVTIDEQTILGINCTVIDNITITSKSQVGAGAVVVKDLVKKGVYIGVPAKLISE